MTYSTEALAQKGIPLEKYVARFFEMLGFGAQYDHNNFNPSAYANDNHNIVDGVLKDKALFELTNPEETTFMNDEIMLNKLEYFKRTDPKHLLKWFLIVSFAVFSDLIKGLIDKFGINLIVLNYHADKTNSSTFIRHLFKTRLYSVLKHLKPKNRKFSSSSNLSVTTLSQYTSSVVSSQALDILNYLHRHNDTVEKDTVEDSRGHLNRFPDRPRFDEKPRFS